MRSLDEMKMLEGSHFHGGYVAVEIKRNFVEGKKQKGAVLKIREVR